MKAKVIFSGTSKEKAILEAALEHYIKAVECTYGTIRTIPPRPKITNDNPLAELRLAKSLARDMSK